jgi:phenylalanyl-tRNA synthetase beta chain
VDICDWASQRAAQLILETAGGQLAEGVVDVQPTAKEAKTIVLRYAKTEALLGIKIPHAEQVTLLGKLGFAASAQTNDSCAFTAPSWRVDLKRETDLIEEIERLHGLAKTPATPPRGAIGTNDFDSIYDQIGEVRRILAGLGLNEAQGQTLIAKSEVRNAKDEEIVALANPLSSDMDVLRPSLLPGLLHSLRHNVTRKNYDVALFEIGRVFRNADLPVRSKGEDAGRAKLELRAPIEERRVAIALTGQRALNFWSGAERDAKFDGADLKGLVEELLEQFGVRGVAFARRETATGLFLESATITLGGKLPLGEFGLVSPVLAKKYDLRDAVLLAELNLDQLLARRNAAKSFKTLPQFPSSRRDVAMLVPEAVTHDAVLQAVKQAKASNLEAVELFDVFRGKNVPEGQKSLAYAFTYRGTDKTLTDAEVNSAHEKVVEQLRQKLAAVMR